MDPSESGVAMNSELRSHAPIAGHSPRIKL
jgi:hypothetical protein